MQSLEIQVIYNLWQFICNWVPMSLSLQHKLKLTGSIGIHGTIISYWTFKTIVTNVWGPGKNEVYGGGNFRHSIGMIKLWEGRGRKGEMRSNRGIMLMTSIELKNEEIWLKVHHLFHDSVCRKVVNCISKFSTVQKDILDHYIRKGRHHHPNSFSLENLRTQSLKNAVVGWFNDIH